MSLEEIIKGMPNAAEAINNNFNNATIVESGTNENGTYMVFGNGIVVSFGSKEFTKSSGWRTGDSLSFDNNNIRTAYPGSQSILYSDYNAELYDGQASFQDIQTRTSKINSRSGSVEVVRLNGNVSAATSLIVRYLHISRINN